MPIEFVGQGNYEVEDKVQGGWVKTDEAPTRGSGEYINDGDRWTPEEFLAEFGNVKTSAMPEEEILYHGADGNTIRQIAQDGIVKVPDYSGQVEHDLTPLNRAYFTSDLGYALIYALGANMVGKDVSNWLSAGNIKEPEGGIVVVRPGGNCVPDEDWLGEIICTWYATNIRDERDTWEKEIPETVVEELIDSIPLVIEELDYIGNRVRRDQYESLDDYDVWGRIGKAVIRNQLSKYTESRIPDNVWKKVLNYSPSYSCDEELKVISAWVFDKVRDNPKFKKDGSNFFEIATQIYP